MSNLKLLAKGLFFACFLFFSVYNTYGQNEIDTTFSSRMNYIFQSLEKNRVPDGLLLDYAMEFTNLSNFNGTTVTDSNKVMPSEFWEIYKTLYLSRIHPNGFTIQNPSKFDSLWFTQRDYGKIVLAGLFYNYSRFADDAVQSNLLTIQGEQIFDKYINGVWQNPYQTEKLFAISPSIEVYEGKSFQVVLPSNLWQTNDSGEISNLSIDPNDGQGYRTITTGQAVSLNYSDTGTKIWTYRLQLTNGQYLYGQSQVRIKNAITDSGCTRCRFGTTKREVLNFTADEPYLGAAATGSITIDYRDADFGLRRPLIVVEGYDAGHILAPELPFGTSTINDFYTNVNITTSGSADLDNIIRNNPEYDIIYVDWHDGTDYLQRNGMLLETIIRWINNNKEPLPGGGFADNIVLGQSMGGVIARWALRDMETRLNQQHHTRMFISMDAPQQGANVPASYQHLARHLRSIYLQTNIAGSIELFQLFMNGPSPFRILSLADQPASRQMLINWVNGSGTIDNTWHNQWESELRNLGYPVQNNIRNIAISNGTECGTTQPFTPGAELLNVNGKANSRFLGDIVGEVAFPFMGLFLGQSSFYLGILPGRNDINYEFTANAQPELGVSQRIYHGKISYTKKVLWLIPVTVTITERNNNSDPSLLAYDYYPGGQIIIDNINDINFQNALAKFQMNFSQIPTFCFIPTPSALDIGLNNVSLSNTDYLARYIGGAPPATPKNTPFQNFVTAFNNQQTNEQHIGFFQRNGNWLVQELTQTANPPPNPPVANCSSLCGLSVSGPNSVCDDATFSVPLIAGATYTWTSDNSFFINTFPNNNTIDITRKRPGSTNITLTVRIASADCGTISVSKTFQYGATFTIINGPYDITQNTIMGVAYTNTTYYFTASESSQNFPAQSYTWTLFPPTGNPTLYSGSKPYITFNEVGDHTLQVSKMTDCGAIVSSIVINVQQNISGFQMMTSPNPLTTDIMTVSIDNESSQVQALPADGNTVVELFRFSSSVKFKQWTFKNKQKKFQLNLANLPKGNYILRITKGNYQQSKQIIIE